MYSISLATSFVRSAAELTSLWSDLAPPHDDSVRSLNLTWLDPTGTTLGAVLCLTGLAAAPDATVPQFVRELHDGLTGGRPHGVAHLAVAIRRPGTADITPEDAGWADALGEEMASAIEESWSLHVLAGGRTAMVVPTPTSTWTSIEGIRRALDEVTLGFGRPR